MHINRRQRFFHVRQLVGVLALACAALAVAHFAYGPWQGGWFDNYWKYWAVNTALAAVTLWFIDWVLTKIFPLPAGDGVKSTSFSSPGLDNEARGAKADTLNSIVGRL